MTLRANPFSLVARPSLVDPDNLSTTTTTIEQSAVAAGKSFTLTGTLAIAQGDVGAIAIAVPSDTAASYVFDMTNALADLTYTANAIGYGGNDITVTHVTPVGVTATLGVVVTGNDIVVNLGKAASAVNSTAAQVKALINSDPAASALVTCEDEGNGSGIVNALTVENLAGGALDIDCRIKPMALSCAVGPVIVSFMEDYTFTGNTSTLTPMNKNRTSTSDSVLAVTAGADATVVNGAGALTLEIATIPASPVGIQRMGVTGTVQEEWKLVPGGKYLFAFTNSYAGQADVRFGLLWTEI